VASEPTLGRPSSDTPGQSGLRGDPKLAVCCPDCGKPGWVRMSWLPRAMRCPACRGYFWVDATGRVRSKRQSATVRFRCPRCRQVDHLPEEFVAGGVVCIGCRGKFYAGPDGTFHSREELDALREAQAAAAAAEPASRRRKARDRPPAWAYAPLGGLAAAGLLAAILAAAAFSGGAAADRSAEAVAARFTTQCFTGRAEEARQTIVPGQDDAFRAWLALCCRAPSRPAAAGPQRPPEVTVVSAVSAGEDAATLRLQVKLPGRGTLLQSQHWRREDGRWRFDARRTLAALGGDEA
jgi:hypothetical protein